MTSLHHYSSVRSCSVPLPDIKIDTEAHPDGEPFEIRHYQIAEYLSELRPMDLDELNRELYRLGLQVTSAHK